MSILSRITKAEVLDILNMFDFFQGQRANRELWFVKPRDIQDEDIKEFTENIDRLREYVCDRERYIAELEELVNIERMQHKKYKED